MPVNKTLEAAGSFRATKEWDPDGEITQKRQFREKTPLLPNSLISLRGTGGDRQGLLILSSVNC